ncbi:MAG: hypothetical protein Fur0024_1180 [Patescibacteria group bacterium]
MKLDLNISKLDKNFYKIFSITISFIILISFSIFSYFNLYSKNQNLEKKIEKVDKNFLNILKKFEEDTIFKNYKNDFILNQLTDGMFPNQGQIVLSKDSKAMVYKNEHIGFSGIVPTKLVLNTIGIDYRISSQEPNGTIFLVSSTNLTSALTAKISKNHMKENLLIYGTVFSKKEDFDKAFEQAKTPIDGRKVTFGKQNFGTTTYDIIDQDSNKTFEKIQIFAPDYTQISGNKFYYIFWIGGDFDKFKTDISVFQNSLTITN